MARKLRLSIAATTTKEFEQLEEMRQNAVQRLNHDFRKHPKAQLRDINAATPELQQEVEILCFNLFFPCPPEPRGLAYCLSGQGGDDAALAGACLSW